MVNDPLRRSQDFYRDIAKVPVRRVQTSHSRARVSPHARTNVLDRGFVNNTTEDLWTGVAKATMSDVLVRGPIPENPQTIESLFSTSLSLSRPQTAAARLGSPDRHASSKQRSRRLQLESSDEVSRRLQEARSAVVSKRDPLSRKFFQEHTRFHQPDHRKYAEQYFTLGQIDQVTMDPTSAFFHRST